MQGKYFLRETVGSRLLDGSLLGVYQERKKSSPEKIKHFRDKEKILSHLKHNF